ncbi:MAG: metalloregulator ArsR/SmtB family transcription factor [Rectinemataceae bacterium]|jgi:ArsR family transcriptional regulator
MIHSSAGVFGPSILKRQADIFSALASPARIAIVRALADRDMSVTDLVELLVGLDCGCSMERTNISKHLAVLRRAGILSSHGDAQRRIYSLEARCLLEAIDCVLSKGCSSVWSHQKKGSRG